MMKRYAVAASLAVLVAGTGVVVAQGESPKPNPNTGAVEQLPTGLTLSAFKDASLEEMNDAEISRIRGLFPKVPTPEANEDELKVDGVAARDAGRVLVTNSRWRLSAVPFEAPRHPSACVTTELDGKPLGSSCFHEFGGDGLAFANGRQESTAYIYGVANDDVAEVVVTTTTGKSARADLKNGGFVWSGDTSTYGTIAEVRSVFDDGTDRVEKIPSARPVPS